MCPEKEVQREVEYVYVARRQHVERFEHMSPTDKRKRLVPSTALVPFESIDIRRTRHNDLWYYSITDVIAALTTSTAPRQYWGMLKGRLKGEGSEVLTDCLQLKFDEPSETDS